MQQKSLEQLEKPKKGWGGARNNSGPKVNIERLVEAAKAEGYEIAKAEFWVKLAQEKAVPRLLEILDSPMDVVGGKTLMSAVVTTIDRALGKPKETHELMGKNGGPIETTTKDDKKIQELCEEYERKLKDALIMVDETYD